MQWYRPGVGRIPPGEERCVPAAGGGSPKGAQGLSAGLTCADRADVMPGEDGFGRCMNEIGESRDL